MKCCSFALPLVLYTLATLAAELSAQNPPSASSTRQRCNQVFVKVIMPDTECTPQEDGPVVESWVAEQLTLLRVSEYSAVTDWVRICDGLLADDEVNNRVWSGQLVGKHTTSFCPVGGDLPEREGGRVLVLVDGWAPGPGYAAKVTLADEPGIRAVVPVMHHSVSGDNMQIPVEKPLAYVAILIGPPPQKRAKLHSRDE